MAYDAADGYVLLFGGQNSTSYLGDTWNFTQGNWTRLNVSTAPSNRSEASMVYDSGDGYVLLFGGTSGTRKAWGDTWSFKGGSWFNATGPAGPGPSPRFGASIVDDVADGFVLLLGGESPTGALLTDAWTFHGGRWAYLGDFPQVAGLGTQMVYDAADGYVLAFGAGNGSAAGGNETWKFQKGSWTELFPRHAPSVRTEESLSYDAKDGYVVLYGGVNNTSAMQDTWKFSAGEWYSLQPTANPGPLAFAGEAAPYDVADGYTLLFGGGPLLHPPENATWTYGASPGTALYACRSFGGPNQSACVYSEYGKYFLTNVSFEPDVFGVEAQNNTAYATSVTGTVGGQTVSFLRQAGSSLWWNSSQVSMDQLTPGAVLNVTVTFPGSTVTLLLPLFLTWDPLWLEAAANHSLSFYQYYPGGSGAWDKPFNIAVDLSPPIAQLLGSSISSSSSASLISGTYRLFPNVNLVANFSSDGRLNLTTSVEEIFPPVDIAQVSVTVKLQASAKGLFEVKSSQLRIQYADLTAGASFKVSYRVAGWNESADIGPCEFGMSIGPSIFAQVGFSATFDLAPAAPGTPPGMTLPGLDLIIAGLDLVTIDLTFGVSFGGSLEICNMNLMSLNVEGSITLNLFVQPNPLAISGGNVTGEVDWSGCLVTICAGGFLLGPATIYSWGNQSSGSVGPPDRGAVPATVPVSNWSLMPRTYNVTQYLHPSWVPGTDNGSLIPVFFPHSEYALTSGPSGPLFLYTYDNVSRNESVAYSMQGLTFPEPNGSLAEVPPPPTPGSLPMNPSVLALPNGSVQAVWDAVPLSEARTGNPFNFDPVFLDSSVYDPGTGSWGPVMTLTSHGAAASSRLGLCGTRPVALVVVGDPANNTSSLEELDLGTKAVLSSVRVPGVALISGFDCAASLASLTLDVGGTELVDLTTGTPRSLPQVPGYNRTALALAPGTFPQAAVLLENQTQDELLLWNETSGTLLAQGTLPFNATAVQLVSTSVGAVAVVQLADALEILLASNGTWIPLRTLHYGSIQSFETAFDGTSLSTAVVVGNGGLSHPGSSLDWNVLPLFPTLTSSAQVVDAGESFTLSAARSQVPDVTTYRWSGLPGGCNAYVGLLLVCALPAGLYHANVTAVLANGRQFPSQSLLLTVNPDPTVTLSGSPGARAPGTAFQAIASSKGGTLPYTYAWYLNGTLVGNASGSSLGFVVPHAGNYTIAVRVTDAAGVSVVAFYEFTSAPPAPGGFPGWDLLLMALLALGGGALLMAGVMLFPRKRRSQGKVGPVSPTPPGTDATKPS
jgi:hypothetical protein